MSACGTFGMCGKKPDCHDLHCPGREEARLVEMYALAAELADESARSDVETIALIVPSNHDMPIYDLSRLDPFLPQDDEMLADYRACLEKAVRYLDMRQMLVRPIEGKPHMVSFGGSHA